MERFFCLFLVLFGFNFAYGQQVTNTADTGSGSLRAAIAAATAGDVLTFDSGLNGATITFGSQILIDKNLTIDASSLSDGVVLDANGSVTSSRVFTVDPGAIVVGKRLKLTGGDTSIGVNGGGVLVSGSLTLEDSTISGNSASGLGGGIYVNTGSLVLDRCTVSDNSGSSGGGIANVNGSSSLINSTIAENTAVNSGGGVFVFDAFLFSENSTITGNSSSSGGGVTEDRSSFTSTNTIISGNTATTDANLQGSISGSNNLIDSDAMLAPLGDNGGPTQTMPPLFGSSAINGGTTSTLATDQRGIARSIGSSVDIGAVETQEGQLTVDISPDSAYLAGAQWRVLGESSATAFNPSDGSLSLPIGTYTVQYLAIAGWGSPSSEVIVVAADEESLVAGAYVPPSVENLNDTGVGSLRDTVQSVAFGSTILFDPSLAGETITLTSGAISLDKNLVIDASGIGGITIESDGSDRVFTVDSGATVTGKHLKLTGGETSVGVNGGGVLVSGSLTLEDSTISGNSASGLGGGIYVNAGALVLDRCTVSDNSGSSGGGIANVNGSSSLINSTIAENTAVNSGGGVFVFDAFLVSENSTIAGNSSSSGGGVTEDRSSFTSTNTIISGNTATTDANLQGSISGSNNLVDSDALLVPLGDNGGPTQTMPPLPGSPVVDAGTDTGTLSSTDQRGISRVLSGGYGPPVVDIGAVEWNGWLVGQDVSSVEAASLLAGSVYDGLTVFPVGFDPVSLGMLGLLSGSEQSALVSVGEDNVTSDPSAFGLYTESSFRALALGRPVLSVNSETGKATVVIGLSETDDLSAAFSPLTSFSAAITESGEIEIEFDVPSENANFYQVFGQEPVSNP